MRKNIPSRFCHLMNGPVVMSYLNILRHLSYLTILCFQESSFLQPSSWKNGQALLPLMNIKPLTETEYGLR